MHERAANLALIGYERATLASGTARSVFMPAASVLMAVRTQNEGGYRVAYTGTDRDASFGCDASSRGMANDRRDRQARTDQRDSPDRTEPALANHPLEST